MEKITLNILDKYNSTTNQKHFKRLAGRLKKYNIHIQYQQLQEDSKIPPIHTIRFNNATLTLSSDTSVPDPRPSTSISVINMILNKLNSKDIKSDDISGFFKDETDKNPPTPPHKDDEKDSKKERDPSPPQTGESIKDIMKRTEYIVKATDTWKLCKNTAPEFEYLNSDRYYCALPKEVWEYIISRVGRPPTPYVSERRDCDDYSKWFAGKTSVLFGANGCCIVWSNEGGHAFNAMLCVDENNKITLERYEPQTARWVSGDSKRHTLKGKGKFIW